MEAHVTRFLDEVSRWAAERPDVRAAILLGSQARVDAPADPASDVDVTLFVDDPASYLDDTAWIGHFGEPLLSFREPTAVGGFEEQRVLFRDGLEVDFAIVPAAVAAEIPPEADAVFARGFQILYADGMSFPEREPSTIDTSPPTQEQFDQLVNDFWYHLLWSAKKSGAARCSSRSRRATAGSPGGWSSSLAGDPRSPTRGTARGSSSAGPGTSSSRRSDRPSPPTTRRTSPARCARRQSSSARSRTTSPHATELAVPEDRPEVLRRLETLLD
jgi:hypothetical protein